MSSARIVFGLAAEPSHGGAFGAEEDGAGGQEVCSHAQRHSLRDHADSLMHPRKLPDVDRCHRTRGETGGDYVASVRAISLLILMEEASACIKT